VAKPAADSPGKPFNFKPAHKPLIHANHTPKMRGPSTAMERRLRVAPFTHKPAVPDPKLKDKLTPEGPGILRWMINGCLEWQRDGLNPPASVIGASKAYFDTQDALGRWIEDSCILDPNKRLPPTLLRTNYNNWAKVNGEEEMDGAAFAEAIDQFEGARPDPWQERRHALDQGARPEAQAYRQTVVAGRQRRCRGAGRVMGRDGRDTQGRGGPELPLPMWARARRGCMSGTRPCLSLCPCFLGWCLPTCEEPRASATHRRTAPMSETEAPGIRIEFVCSVCLASAYSLDTAKPPHCRRCGIRMEADSAEPARRANSGSTTRRPGPRPGSPAPLHRVIAWKARE
jgi:hypothetical protein